MSRAAGVRKTRRHRLIYRSYGSLLAMAPPTAGSAAGPTMSDPIAESRRRHAEALEMGAAQAVDRHSASGRLPVRERIALLTDEGSWFEPGALPQPERYCVDYTSRHDLSVCDDIMVPGYTLHMGVHELAGRDDAYKPAAAAQFRQFPGLCLTVNEIICSG